jgi:threonine/homoserine/homoserine lactone efflux protein
MNFSKVTEIVVFIYFAEKILMNLLFLFKGLMLGFSVAAPVGPIGILCINKTLNRNFAAGFVSGLGAATADLIYGLIAGLGLTVISNFLVDQKAWIQLIGLVFLFYIGAKTLLKKENETNVSVIVNNSLFKDYVSTFFLTVTNPLTILFFLAVFAGMGLSNTGGDVLSILFLVIGVFLGSGIWWLILSTITLQLKSRLNNKILKLINISSGLLIIAFGLFILADLIKEMI